MGCTSESFSELQIQQQKCCTKTSIATPIPIATNLVSRRNFDSMALWRKHKRVNDVPMSLVMPFEFVAMSAIFWNDSTNALLAVRVDLHSRTKARHVRFPFKQANKSVEIYLSCVCNFDALLRKSSHIGELFCETREREKEIKHVCAPSAIPDRIMDGCGQRWSFPVEKSFWDLIEVPFNCPSVQRIATSFMLIARMTQWKDGCIQFEQAVSLTGTGSTKTEKMEFATRLANKQTFMSKIIAWKRTLSALQSFSIESKVIGGAWKPLGRVDAVAAVMATRLASGFSSVSSL